MATSNVGANATVIRAGNAEIQANMESVVLPKEPLVRSEKIGRNDPCPCGSGKKFKKCCIKKSV